MTPAGSRPDRWRHRAAPRTARGRAATRGGPTRDDRRAGPALRGAMATGLATAVPMAVIGFVVFGGPGALVGLAAAATATQLRADPGRALALAAFTLFAAAATATALEVGPVSIRYARDRELAASLAAVGGVALGCALLSCAVRERASAPPAGRAGPATAPPAGPSQAAGSTGRLGPAGLSGLAVVAGMVALGSAAMSWITAADVVPGACAEIVDNVADGTGYAAGDGARAYPSAACSPAGPFVAAFWPLGARFGLAVAAAGTGAAAVVLARRLGGRRSVGATVALTLGLAPWWAQDLPSALAALGLTTAVVLARPPDLDPRRAAAAGAAAALAALARPEVLVVIPLVVATAAARQRAHGALLAATALASVLPWALWAHANVGRWWPGGAGGISLWWSVPVLAALGATAVPRRVSARRAPLASPGSERAGPEPRPGAKPARER